MKIKKILMYFIYFKEIYFKEICGFLWLIKIDFLKIKYVFNLRGYLNGMSCFL